MTVSRNTKLNIYTLREITNIYFKLHEDWSNQSYLENISIINCVELRQLGGRTTKVHSVQLFYFIIYFI